MIKFVYEDGTLAFDCFERQIFAYYGDKLIAKTKPIPVLDPSEYQEASKEVREALDGINYHYLEHWVVLFDNGEKWTKEIVSKTLADLFSGYKMLYHQGVFDES